MVKIAGIEWILKKHEHAFSHHEALSIAVSDWCKVAIPTFNAVNWSYEQSVACICLLQTSRRAHDGIGYLCEQGLASEALSLVRKLFEAYVNAKYIHLDSTRNAALFIYHPLITEVVRKERLWRLKGSPQEIEHYEGIKESAYVTQVNGLLSTVAQALGKSACDFSDLERLARFWSGCGLLDMCRAIDREPEKAGVKGQMFEKIYEGEFRDLCEYTHGTGSNIAQGTKLDESTIDSDFRRTDTYVPEALIHGSKLYIWLLHDLAQVIDGEIGLRLYNFVVRPFLETNRELAHHYKMTTEIA